MIERINEIYAEVNAPFAVLTKGKAEILLNREIGKLLQRSSDIQGSRCVTQRPLRRTHESGRINKRFARCTHGAVTSVVQWILQRHTGNDVETNRAIGTAQPVSVSDERYKRLTALKSNDAGDGPSTQNTINDTRRIGQELAPFAKRQIVEHRGGKVVLDVKSGDRPIIKSVYTIRHLLAQRGWRCQCSGIRTGI